MCEECYTLVSLGDKYTGIERAPTILLHDLVFAHDEICILDRAWLFLGQRINDIGLCITHGGTEFADDSVVELLGHGWWFGRCEISRIDRFVGINASIEELFWWQLEVGRKILVEPLILSYFGDGDALNRADDQHALDEADGTW